MRGSQRRGAEIGALLQEVDRELEDLTWRSKEFIKDKLRSLSVRVADLEEINEQLVDEVDTVNDRLATALSDLRAYDKGEEII